MLFLYVHLACIVLVVLFMAIESLRKSKTLNLNELMREEMVNHPGLSLKVMWITVFTLPEFVVCVHVLGIIFRLFMSGPPKL